MEHVVVGSSVGARFGTHGPDSPCSSAQIDHSVGANGANRVKASRTWVARMRTRRVWWIGRAAPISWSSVATLLGRYPYVNNLEVFFNLSEA